MLRLTCTFIIVAIFKTTHLTRLISNLKFDCNDGHETSFFCALASRGCEVGKHMHWLNLVVPYKFSKVKEINAHFRIGTLRTHSANLCFTVH